MYKGGRTMPTIRVDEEVWTELQKKAEPLVDNPNSVLRRILGLSDAKARKQPGNGRSSSAAAARPGRHRAIPGTILAGTEYRKSIVDALASMGGEGRRAEVLKSVYEIVKDRLTAIDRQAIPSGSDIRWKKRASWEAYNMTKDELLDRNAPNGIWRLADAGWRLAGRSPA